MERGSGEEMVGERARDEERKKGGIQGRKNRDRQR
jgi:hypothetical protein